MLYEARSPPRRTSALNDLPTATATTYEVKVRCGSSKAEWRWCSKTNPSHPALENSGGSTGAPACVLLWRLLRRPSFIISPLPFRTKARHTSLIQFGCVRAGAFAGEDINVI